MAMSKLDFNTEEEKDSIEQVFRSAIFCLSEEDRGLPAIELMLPLVKRGIAVHHSGLLPLIKELVELLFQEGLVKALFATETVCPLTLITRLALYLFCPFTYMVPLPKSGRSLVVVESGRSTTGGGFGQCQMLF